MTVGIKDVARVAQVSPATASRVLAGRSVDPAMQERVLAAVKSTGYRPNMAARRLRSRHSNTIGLIVADIRNPFFTAVSRTVEDIAYARGMRVILCNTDENPEREAMYLQLMHEERVTGAILAPTRQATRRANALRSDFPLVLIDRAAAGAYDSVLLDNSAMAEQLVAHLHEQGHRRIAGLFGAASSTGAERQAGFERAASALGIQVESLFVPHGAEETDKAVTRALASHAAAPSALVASNGKMLMAILRALHGMGLSVPDDIAVAGFDNEGWMDLAAGGVTVIEQPVEEIGRTAMSMLLDRIEHPDGAARKVVLTGKLVARGSSALSQAAKVNA
ncbi:LacI family DNA-binding transcriptional regulator [Sphingomonas sp.]|uniref:LacI family DNA-binding transcriptional regulator n=1 Tax=Sphingomonas sp. TaxID=28214 RepID=UPI000DB7243C|nr:LacI family DNA-binding transcriptional regulator [Sphingomonas sp.]PZU07732.1 MAG: LacI family transcriptional regulator [Sphingomonas sp.]